MFSIFTIISYKVNWDERKIELRFLRKGRQHGLHRQRWGLHIGGRHRTALPTDKSLRSSNAQFQKQRSEKQFILRFKFRGKPCSSLVGALAWGPNSPQFKTRHLRIIFELFWKHKFWIAIFKEFPISLKKDLLIWDGLVLGEKIDRTGEKLILFL